MTIIHYLMGLPPVRGGGLIQYAADLAKEQQQAGHQVFFCSPVRSGEGTGLRSA